MGRTDRHGTLTARVPSGPISVEAEVPIDQWNWADISLTPGQSESVEIRRDEQFHDVWTLSVFGGTGERCSS